MKNLFLSLSMIAATGVSAISCGDSSSSSAPKPEVKQPPLATTSAEGLALQSTHSDDNLLGQWASDCLVNPENGKASRVTMDIQNNFLSQGIMAYNDTNCKIPAFEIKIVATYDATASTLKTATRLFTAIIHRVEYSSAASRAASCGFNLWKPEVEYDVTNLKCPAEKEGINFTGNKRGTTATLPISISAADGSSRLTAFVMDMAGTRMTREMRAGETIDETRLIPAISGSIFADKEYADNEALLKAKGCKTSINAGIYDCKAPQNLEEAAETYTQIHRFSIGIRNDARFRNVKYLQPHMESGFYSQLATFADFAPYAAATKALNADLLEFTKAHPDLQLIAAVGVNALDARKGLMTLTEVSQQPGFDAEMQRLNVKAISINKTFWYTKSPISSLYSISWDYTDTAANIWNKIQAIK